MVRVRGTLSEISGTVDVRTIPESTVQTTFATTSTVQVGSIAGLTIAGGTIGVETEWSPTSTINISPQSTVHVGSWAPSGTQEVSIVGRYTPVVTIWTDHASTAGEISGSIDTDGWTKWTLYLTTSNASTITLELSDGTDWYSDGEEALGAGENLIWSDIHLAKSLRIKTSDASTITARILGLAG